MLPDIDNSSLNSLLRLGVVPVMANVTAQPEDDPRGKRIGVKGSLGLWRERMGQGKHSFIADPKWADPGAIAAARSRRRGWPNRFFDREPFKRETFRVAEDSPCIGAGEGGVTIGADTTY